LAKIREIRVSRSEKIEVVTNYNLSLSSVIMAAEGASATFAKASMAKALFDITFVACAASPIESPRGVTDISPGIHPGVKGQIYPSISAPCRAVASAKAEAGESASVSVRRGAFFLAAS
jgi:hypothetical protein